MKSNGLDLILNKYDLICGLSVFLYCKRIIQTKNYSKFIERNLKCLKALIKVNMFQYSGHRCYKYYHEI